jgi:hypothetical protein
VTPEEHIAKMTTAIKQAIKVMGNRFGSTEGDVARAIEELKLVTPRSERSSRTVDRDPDRGWSRAPSSRGQIQLADEPSLRTRETTLRDTW